MAISTVSYGSISIVDLTDIGEFSVYPKCNLPLTVIYNPDQNTYTPNWGTNNLTIQPSIWYAGTNLAATASGVTVTWTRQEGVSSPGALTSGETVTNGILTVSANKFNANIPMITYIVNVTYTEPTSGQTLRAEGQITFSLVKMAASLKFAEITGETIFKYRGNGSIVGSSSIVLTGRVEGNISISAWQYLNSNNQWVTYPGSDTSTTLTVNATDQTFINNDTVCTIRLLCTDNSIYDLHTITKLKDGADGTSIIAAVLTNEDQMIPCNAQGTPTSFDGAESRIIVYKGSDEDTVNWSINIQSSSGVTYEKSTNGTNYVSSSTSGTNYSYVRVTGMTSETGNITFTCSKSGQSDIIKTFSLIKMKTGANGVSPTIYTLEVSAVSMNKAYPSNAYSPTSVTLNAYSITGQTKTAYAGRFKIREDGGSTAIYTSTTNESSHQYTPENTTMTHFVCELYQAGGTSTLLDSQTVVITSDGQKGDQGNQGPAGTDSLNIVFGNYYDSIITNSSNKTTASTTIIIPFAGYKGISKVATSLTNTIPKLFNVSPTVKAATTSEDGEIKYQINANTTVSSESGTLSFTFLIEGTTVVQNYRWGRTRLADDGENAVFLQIYTPNSNCFDNGSGVLTCQAVLMDGSTDVTSSATYQWAKYSNGTYTNLTNTANVSTGVTTSTCTIYPACVDGYASFRCTATYQNKAYIQYVSLMDKTDPVQVTVLSSIGNQIVNGQGIGALYVKVVRNGDEIDPIKTETFVTDLSSISSPAINDYAYLLDTQYKTAVLYQYSGSQWTVVQTTPYIGTYAWSYRNKDGDPISGTGTPSTTGKVVYIDGTLIDKKIIADVEVTI